MFAMNNIIPQIVTIMVVTYIIRFYVCIFSSCWTQKKTEASIQKSSQAKLDAGNLNKFADSCCHLLNSFQIS